MLAAIFRFTGIGALIGVLILIALKFPPFPPALYTALFKFLQAIFQLDAYIPTKLAANLLLTSWLIDALILSMKAAIWVHKQIFSPTD